MSLTDNITALQERILAEGVLDDEQHHHVFVSGLHGRKLDFDLIETGSEFYHQWVKVTADYIRENYAEQPDAVIGVANGTNRFAISLAAELGNGVLGLMTEKNDDGRTASLHKSVRDVIQGYKPKFLLIVEDVGTTGSFSSSVAKLCKEAGAERVEVLHTWIRSENLPRLDEAGFVYNTLIHQTFPNYPAEACEFCKNGSVLVNHEA